MAIVGGRIRKSFDISHDVVTGVADSTTGQTRKLGGMSGAEGLQALPNFFERVRGIKFLAPVLIAHGDPFSSGTDFHKRVGREKTITANAFATDNTFKQTGAATGVNSLKRGRRRQRIA